MQIAARRNLVSSIKDSAINPEDNEVSYKGRESSYSNMGVTSTGVDSTKEDYDSDILSTNYVYSTKNEVQENQTSYPTRSFSEGEENEKSIRFHNSALVVDSSKQLKDSSSQKVWSNDLPSYLSSSTKTSSTEDQKDQEKETTSYVKNDEASIPTHEEENPPPLAGANVMNVILVAAECAPWSKTGIKPWPNDLCICIMFYVITKSLPWLMHPSGL